jgi:hypothetical protein
MQLQKEEFNMSNWERRDADTLADAIGKHVRNFPDLVAVNKMLIAIRVVVDEASTTVNTTPGELQRYRAQVCSLCRGNNLYRCDVPEGWSENCAFIFYNTSQFGDL